MNTIFNIIRAGWDNWTSRVIIVGAIFGVGPFYILCAGWPVY